MADLDADGAPDIATLGASELNLFVLKQDGQYVRRTLPSGQNPMGVAIADFDANGWGDAVVLNVARPAA